MTEHDPAADAAEMDEDEENLDGEAADTAPAGAGPQWQPIALNGAKLQRMRASPGVTTVPELGLTRRDLSTRDTDIIRPDPVAAKAEEMLTKLIFECHFMMKEVAFRSMCQCIDPTDRRRFMDSAMDFAKTGAEVAGAIAVLRGGSPVRETRQRIVIERLESVPVSAMGRGERWRGENNDQAVAV